MEKLTPYTGEKRFPAHAPGWLVRRIENPASVRTNAVTVHTVANGPPVLRTSISYVLGLNGGVRTTESDDYVRVSGSFA